MVLQQRFVPEHHIIIYMEVFHELVPAWRMLHSSTSALGHDQTDEHCFSNHMLSDCLVLGSHSCISTASFCPSRIAGSGFAFTALGTFFAHPGHIVVGTVVLELTLLCTFDVLWTRLEPSSQVLCTPGLRQDSWSSTSCCAFAYVGHLSLIRFQLCHCSSLLVCLLAPLAIRALARRNGRRAVFGQEVRYILLLLGNLFRLGRPGLRRFALTALTAVKSESEAAI